MNVFKQMMHRRKCPSCGDTFEMIKWAPKDVTCVGCSDHAPQEDDSDPHVYAERVRMRGLMDQKHARDAIGLRAGEDPVLRQDPPYEYSAGAVKLYLRAPERWTLILSGRSGKGKTVAACYAAWVCAGIFIPRPAWTRLGALERDVVAKNSLHAQERAISERPSLVVLDDVFAVDKGGKPGDDKWSSEVVWRIVLERHAAKRPTILTTNASEEALDLAYGTKGRAILERAKAGHDENGAPWKGGFVECL